MRSDKKPQPPNYPDRLFATAILLHLVANCAVAAGGRFFLTPWLFAVVSVVPAYVFLRRRGTAP